MPSTWHETLIFIKYSVAVANVNVVKYNPAYSDVIEMLMSRQRTTIVLVRLRRLISLFVVRIQQNRFPLEVKQHQCKQFYFYNTYIKKIDSEKQNTVKPVLSGHSKRCPKIGFQDRLSLNAGQKYCRMLQESILQYF